MPQMAPMMWLNLFIIFSLTFLVFLIMNYFNKNVKKIDLSPDKIKTESLNWKW